MHISELRYQFEYVYQCAYIELVCRGIAAGKLVDGLVLVWEAAWTQRAVARRFVANLRTSRIRVGASVASPVVGPNG